MQKLILFLILSIFFLSCSEQYRHLPVSDYVDKMKGGWVGQMAGVGWGGPTEFDYMGKIIPEDSMPAWKPEMINQFGQDDIYVEMTFLRTLELYGMDVSLKQAGIDFANSGYFLWHANRAGRDNLRNGIAPPDAGHPQFNKHADDIDYQIESDYSGLIAPGLPNVVIQLGEKFGRLMNYGDGLYGGQFVGGMYAEAFFENDMVKIVEAGLKCIPEKSQYAECIGDVINWYKQNPDDWQKTWQLIEDKYQTNPEYRRFSCSRDRLEFNIDAKINGAYIVMGLLYGKRDPDETIIISTRCGQDSDCNPSNAAGILFTTIGFSNLPNKFKSALNEEEKFSHTVYNFPTLIEVSKKLVRQSLERNGGKIEKDENGNEVFLIPYQKPVPSKFEQCWEPGPIANSTFSDEDMDKIETVSPKEIQAALDKISLDWDIFNCGKKAKPVIRKNWGGKENVLVTYPKNEETACILVKWIRELPEGKEIRLSFYVGHDPDADWDLSVRLNWNEVIHENISKETSKKGWKKIDLDLSEYAGRGVHIALIHSATGWEKEAAYWANIEVTGI